MNIDIIDVLISDHEKLKNAMDRLKEAIEKNFEELDPYFSEFKHLFYLHDKIENKVVYPAFLKGGKALKNLVMKAYQAHHMAEVGLLELKVTPFRSENWGPKFLVIRDAILQHIKEEEEEIFIVARQMLSKHELESLAKGQEEIRQKAAA